MSLAIDGLIDIIMKTFLWKNCCGYLFISEEFLWKHHSNINLGRLSIDCGMWNITKTNICFRLFKMAPNLFGTSATLYLEASQQDVHQEKSSTEKANTQKLVVQKSSSPKPKYKWKIVWRNVIAFLYLHIGALYGFYLLFIETKFVTALWSKSELRITPLFLPNGSLICHHNSTSFSENSVTNRRLFSFYHETNMKCGLHELMYLRENDNKY